MPTVADATYTPGRRRAILLLLLTSVLLLTLDLRGNAMFDRARILFDGALSPMESAAGVVTNPVRDAWRGITEYDDLISENQRLQQHVDQQVGAEIASSQRDRREPAAARAQRSRIDRQPADHQGGDYLLPVKENQPALLADLEAAFSPLAPAARPLGSTPRLPAFLQADWQRRGRDA